MSKEGTQGFIQVGKVLAEGVLPGGNEPVNSFPADVFVQGGEDVGVNIQQFVPVSRFIFDADAFGMPQKENENSPQ